MAFTMKLKYMETDRGGESSQIIDDIVVNEALSRWKRLNPPHLINRLVRERTSASMTPKLMQFHLSDCDLRAWKKIDGSTHYTHLRFQFNDIRLTLIWLIFPI